MTFKEVAVKNFKGSLRKYMSFFLCNSVSILFLFIYSTLLFNEDLKNSPKLSEVISKVMVIPNVVLIVFCVVFINYSYSIFIKGRKREYGIFMNLGMSISDIRKLIVFENAIIALLSIFLGIIAGTIFSRLFFMIIAAVLKVKDLKFSLGIRPYVFTLGIYLTVFSLSVLITIISTRSFDIINLLKTSKMSTRSKISKPYVGVLGLVITVGALASLIIYFHGDGETLLKCTLALIIGIYLLMLQAGQFITFFIGRNKERYNKNILLISNLKYKFDQTNKILFIITVMIIVVVFISGLYMNLILSAEPSAAKINPYHISFVLEEGKNETKAEDIEKIIKDSNNKVIEHKTIEFIELKGELITSQKDINKAVKSNFNINKGSYLRLRQVDDLDEKDKAMQYTSEQRLKHTGILSELKLKDIQFKLYFNSPGYMFNNLMIVSDEDYEKIRVASDIKKGRVELYNFKDWKKTQELVYNLNKAFREYNKNLKLSLENENYILTASRIETYNENNQGTRVLFFLMAFLELFFLICISIVMSLKIFSDLDNDEVQYKNLYKIGIMEAEYLKIKCNELKILFSTAPTLAIPITVIYSFGFSSDSPSVDKIKIFLCDATIGIVFIILELIYYFLCKKTYMKRISEWS
ncbi:ABC transporter permease [Clostridium sp. C8-1-8]|uniref:ABC transporter permease n=1 Tax=Clostridium sp. C8-1-8 TaxID=2698831 RepID=UPI0013707B91|nr:ABC transporter permease [Clostridium sp. C8-1-8]